MPSRFRFPAWAHLALLPAFGVLMVFVWMLPALLAGYAWTVPGIHAARQFAETSVLPSASDPLHTLILWALHFFIAWNDPFGWAVAGYAALALALVFWWLCVRRLIDTRTAWISAVLFGLMPMYWMPTASADGYAFAYPLIFLASFCFIALHPRHRLLAVAAAGAGLGAALAVYHAFLPFFPWIIAVYLWHRRNTPRRAFLEAGLFCAVAYAAFILPLLPNALQKDLSPLQRIAVFAPPIRDNYTGFGHLYPDAYAFQFYKEDFDAYFLRQAERVSFLEAQQDKNLLINFGVGRVSLWDRLGNGLWLFANSLPHPFFPETAGGAFLWLFIVPGIVFLWRRDRFLCVSLLGLWLSLELLLRFGFHFVRIHTMDIGWMLALFAAVGMVETAVLLQPHWRRLSVSAIAAFMALVACLQLLQVNRTLFARLYARSNVPLVHAVTRVMEDLPDGAVVATPPRHALLFIFSDKEMVLLHDLTLDLLAPKGKLRDPFDYYRVTHILGYDEVRTALITREAPSVQAVPMPPPSVPVTVTPFLRYLLHQFR